MRSGSARRTATSVIAEDIRRNSCARHTRIARNQNRTIGITMVAITATIDGLENSSETLFDSPRLFWKTAQETKAPTTNQTPDAMSAMIKGDREGRCCRA